MYINNLEKLYYKTDFSKFVLAKMLKYGRITWKVKNLFY